ncbi:MAG TPA: GvpL/GvpF family gas vesicle protein [Vicinamibacterales bacterium]|nr:GvpL/GvpF family gas vesicle protein [Vicinamibacterales bacterium]
MADLVYAHCAIRATARPSVTDKWPRMPGGSAPRPLAIGPGLWLLVSTVPAAEYEESGLATRLTDVEWVALCGVAHHDVIARAARTHAVAPFRLLTLFRSEERAVAEATRLKTRIGRALARVNDRREWVVRVAAVSGAAKSRRPGPTSGTSYLMARASEPRVVRAATPGARRVARQLVAELKGYADQIVARQSEAPHVLYDGALLVSREKETELGNVVRQWGPRLAPMGCRVSLTGPWPPYSFVSLDGRRTS